MTNKIRKLKTSLVAACMLSGTTFAYAGPISSLIGDSGIVGQLSGLNIPGVGEVSVMCELPSIRFSDIDLCSIENELIGKIPTIPELSFNIAGCTIGVGLGNDYYGCQQERYSLLCNSDELKKMISLKEMRSGLGGWEQMAQKELALFGGKGVFGDNLCSTDHRRYAEYDKTYMKNTYGQGGWVDRAISDKKIGGSPKFMNKRRTASMLRCTEMAEKNNIDIKECYLNNPQPFANLEPAEIEQKINESAAMGMGPLANVAPGDLENKINKYWQLFYKRAEARGVSDWKMLMAIGMTESRLTPTIDGPENSDGTREYGMMQIGDRHKDLINQWYGSYGGFWQALHLPYPSVDYGAYVLKTCQDQHGASWQAVDCYNKESGGASGSSDYINKVKHNYAVIKNRDFGTPDFPYKEDIKTSQRTATFSVVSEIATQRTRAFTHIGQDTVDKLPLDKQREYTMMVDRYMAQEVLIKGAYKKASDIEKALYHTTSFAGGVASHDLGESTTSSSSGSPTSSSGASAVSGTILKAGQ